jgi:hypothetical protein
VSGNGYNSGAIRSPDTAGDRSQATYKIIGCSVASARQHQRAIMAAERMVMVTFACGGR